jgi:L-asparaginase II
LDLVELSWEPGDNPVIYLRSCAKPLQASLIVDYGLDFSLYEIALCCASHAGEEQHIDLAQRFLDRLKLDKSLLLIPLEHNCIGKHIMMLELCRVNGWDLKTYYEFDHPLQIKIQEKITQLCTLNSPHSIKDGCGVPTWAMPVQNMMCGYLNLFSDPKYEKIRRAFLEFPQIIGGGKCGGGKLDTKIMKRSRNLIAKNGAGGLIVVMNLGVNQAFTVRVENEDPQTREAMALDTIKQLGW